MKDELKHIEEQLIDCQKRGVKRCCIATTSYNKELVAKTFNETINKNNSVDFNFK
jgi:hypothetical protein